MCVMNARQKAKKLKRLKKELHDLEDAYKALQMTNRYLIWEKHKNQSREVPLKFKVRVPFYYDRDIREEWYKQQLVKEVTNYLIDNKIPDIEVERDNINREYVYTATLTVVRK